MRKRWPLIEPHWRVVLPIGTAAYNRFTRDEAMDVVLVLRGWGIRPLGLVKVTPK